MFDSGILDDAGDDLSSAAVAALRSSAAVRACADAVELQAIATLVQVRRAQARALARRLAAGGRRERPGASALPVRVDLEAVDRSTAQEVSLALWLSPVVARDRMQLALELVEDRPATFDALRTGAIDLVRAIRIVDAVRTLGRETLPVACGAAVDDGTAGQAGAVGEAGAEDAGDPTGSARPAGPDVVSASSTGQDAASAVEAEVLYPGSVPLLTGLRPGRPAAELTPAQLTARLSRLVLRASPTWAVRRTEAADARRGCSLRVLPDGMALLSVTGRVELLGAAFGRVDATARALLAAGTGPAGAAPAGAAPACADPACAGPARGGVTVSDAARTLDQTRVDVVLATLLGHSDDLGQAAGVQITVALVAPAATVLAGGAEPGELVGLGPVPAPLVRELVADAAWVRWASDPLTGQIVDVGRRRYRPSAAVADLVRARDGCCRFPTCRRRARACDLDHVVPFPRGHTEPDNLTSLCRTHHLAKHRGGFRLRISPDGTAVWTTPTGEDVLDTAQAWGTRGPCATSATSATSATPATFPAVPTIAAVPMIPAVAAKASTARPVVTAPDPPPF